MLRNAFRLCSAALVAGSIACSDDGGTSAPVAARLGMVTNLGESAQSGVLLSPQPAVQALDAGGNPVASRGMLVTASIANGGGTLQGTVGVRTDTEGRATFTDLVIAGPTGTRTLRFSAPGLSAAISSAVNLTAGPPTVASVNGGGSQTTPAGTAVPVAPSVKVTDGSGNPVVGVQVTFTVTSGGGSVIAADPVTSAQGIATVGAWTMGKTIGQNTLSAAVEGLATPVLFQATAVVGPPAELTVLSGDGQTATILSAVAIAPSVKVADAFGNLITGLAVTFTPADGGTAVGSAISDAEGISRLTAWRLGYVPGATTLTASTPNGPQVVLNATAVHLPVIAITPGGAHSCAIGADHQARCWGDNSVGQMGVGGIVSQDSVPHVVNSAITFDSIVTGLGHSCGLNSAGAAWCWGINTNGELGNGGSSASAVPAPVAGGLVFKQISASASHTCAIDLNGKAYCWGSGANGRLGDGQQTTRRTPSAVGGGHVFSRISAGGAHTCGLRTDGAILCWGSNASGRLGDGTLDGHLLPGPVSSSAQFVDVSAGGNFSCAIDNAGALWCWGANASGQLGDNTTTQRSEPGLVSGGRVYTRVSTGTSHACGITAQATAFCWGENSNAQVGDGTGTDRRVPTAVFGTLSLSEITAGDVNTCARTTLGSGICWGNNQAGQLGDNTTAGKANPTGVHP
ncbi:MAG TPA: Ig-like domain-containing protein [Gemmatimonadales bacterium]|nr:Ig-like domain-containing protein [Gemmatimonadales bacterium]